MRLGIAKSLSNSSAREWAEKHRKLGLSAVVFPVNCRVQKGVIADYKKAADDYGLVIAEVGAWCNLLDRDERKAEENLLFCMKTMEMADEIGAKCVVNISGSCSESFWDGGDRENYSQKTFDSVVKKIEKIISASQNCPFTLEPMPWMLPYDANSYLRLLERIDDPRFAVHMDAVNLINSPEKYFFQKEFLSELFSKLGGYVKSAHLKDVKISNRLTVRLEECSPLEGAFETKLYLDELEKLDADMPVIIEHLDDEKDYLLAVERVKRFCEKESIVLK